MSFIYKHRVAFGIIFAVLLIINLLPTLSQLSLKDWQSYIPESPLWAAVMLLVLYSIKPIIFFVPIYVLYFSAGMLFTTPWALLITYAGLTCEILVGYYIGRFLGRAKVNALLEKNPKAARFLERFNNGNGMACLIARTLPMPPDFSSFFYGASAMPIDRYIIFSLLGLSPAMLPCVVAGTAFTNPLDKSFLIPMALSLLFSFAAYFGQQLWEKYHT